MESPASFVADAAKRYSDSIPMIDLFEKDRRSILDNVNIVGFESQPGRSLLPSLLYEASSQSGENGFG
jgi:hypothetical protein